MPPFVIGLVGGIASGKSSVAALFARERACVHLDADTIARRVRARPSIRNALQRRFPKVYRDPQRLARKVFSDPKALAALEEITHPPIRRALHDAIKRARTPYVLLDAALLMESGLDGLCDAIVYVACPALARRRRAVRDRGWTADDHRAREARQWSLRRKRARADAVVNNGTGLEHAQKDVRKILRRIERNR